MQRKIIIVHLSSGFNFVPWQTHNTKHDKLWVTAAATDEVWATHRFPFKRNEISFYGHLTAKKQIYPLVYSVRNSWIVQIYWLALRIFIWMLSSIRSLLFTVYVDIYGSLSILHDTFTVITYYFQQNAYASHSPVSKMKFIYLSRNRVHFILRYRFIFYVHAIITNC